ncbi:Asp23/Gls24 family envelope stress response protein [Zongyangia hominis]|uniref:Asp23/Gls24 family envelope stress response protein n=1 Tax=Zongyangia hominis TaxID=2763677 RepID=A0A926E946_9FIRM|nr:Asp23/Gls24 family envelope stress response protein [Zongyangia hominis]MBC8569602.1 Asp23/Gls24 family envelope stress response protein [Zongyangia hominis]
MEQRPNKEAIGSLKISEDVLATIAKFAATEVEGVASLAPFVAPIKGFHPAKGKAIRIELNDDIAVIDLNVNLKFGAKVPQVAEQIQSGVKESVQNMTGITVSKVNVTVAGIVFEEAAAQ